MYALTLLAPPVGEPVSLAEMKAWLKVDFPDDDAQIAGLVTAARVMVESQLGRQLVSAQWRMDMDLFPQEEIHAGHMGATLIAGLAMPKALRLVRPTFAEIVIPKSPFQALQSIVYVASDGSTQTVDPATYIIKGNDPAVVAPGFAQIWPPARFQLAGVGVTFAVGYGPATTIPAGVASGTRTVTPASMQGVYVGTVLGIDPGTSAYEQVYVAAVTSTTFTATFAQTHAANCVINCVPETLRLGIKLLAAHWYENREAVNMASVASSPTVPLAFQSLMDSSWNGEY